MTHGAKRRAWLLAAPVALAGLILVLRPWAAAPSARTHAVPAEIPAVEPAGAPPPSERAAVVTSLPAPRELPPGAETPITSAIRPATRVDEAELMRVLRSARDNDPALAVELARDGNGRFPASPDAPERASILIHALAAQGLSSEARGEAEDMVNRYPDSSWVREIERFTGAHRHRNLRVDDQGQLRYVDP